MIVSSNIQTHIQTSIQKTNRFLRHFKQKEFTGFYQKSDFEWHNANNTLCQAEAVALNQVFHVPENAQDNDFIEYLEPFVDHIDFAIESQFMNCIKQHAVSITIQNIAAHNAVENFLLAIKDRFHFYKKPIFVLATERIWESLGLKPNKMLEPIFVDDLYASQNIAWDTVFLLEKNCVGMYWATKPNLQVIKGNGSLYASLSVHCVNAKGILKITL
jgi:hypothetical protein